jgi:hypothetical protein
MILLPPLDKLDLDLLDDTDRASVGLVALTWLPIREVLASCKAVPGETGKILWRGVRSGDDRSGLMTDLAALVSL